MRFFNLSPISTTINLRLFRKLRNEATIICEGKEVSTCSPLSKTCLFDVINDPCELNNLADKFPNIVKALTSRLMEFNSSAIAPGNMPIDQRGNPMFFDHTWTNFGDFV